MSTLSTSILELGFTSERDMEEALARQVMYGGDLGTNLLELGLLTEDQLLQAASHSTDLRAAPVGELSQAPEPLASLIPLELCRRHGVHVVGEEEGHLVIAVSARLSHQIESELAQAAGRPLRQRLAIWARIEQALARAGGRNPTERAVRLLKRLEGRPSWTPVGRGLPVDFKQLPRPQSVPPIEFTAAADFDVSTAPPPEGYVELAQAQGAAPRHDTPPHLYVRAPLVPTTVSTRRRGPYTAAMAERDLLEAKDRHEVLASFFDFSAQYFEYAALFVIKGGEAVGYRARGAGASTERVRSVRVPLDLPSAFVRARDEGTWVLARLRGGGIEGGVARDLARGAGKKVLVLPLLVKGRTVLFLYGDHGNTDVDLTSIGDVLSFAPLASSALQQVILRRKGVAPLRTLAALRPRHAPLPSRDQKAQALAQLVSRAPTPPPPPDADGLEGNAARSALVPLPSEARTWSKRHSSSPPFPSQPPHTLPGLAAPGHRPPTLRGVAAPANPPVAEAATSGEAAAIPMRPTLSLEPEPLDRTGDVPQGVAPPPPRLISDLDEPPEDGWDIDATFEEHERGTAAGVGPRPVLVPSSRPTPPFSQQPPPVDSDALVERLCRGDEAAVQLLPNVDDLVVGALVSRFPGPLPGVRTRENIGKASECGPVLKALLLLGSRAIPYLTVRTADEDAHVREWATRLLGELPSRESAQAVARRTVDDSVDVRRAALAAARMTQHIAEAREGTRGQLEELALDGALPAEVRRAAIEALTDLRESEAVPCMIQLLQDEDREVSGAARWSLVVLTRQDFGADQDYWSRFWTANCNRHRIEWLIDSLTHENRDIRRAAGDELKTLSKEYFGYYDDLPEAERARVQERYRDWWVREGTARFG